MQEKKNKRVFQGVVVSDKMQKTIVVRIDRLIMHPKYKKRIRISKRYKVHDERREFHVGDIVTFCETRPISKEKRWRVISAQENIV